MRILFHIFLLSIMLATVSCNKNKSKEKIEYTYQFNRFYVGNYPHQYYLNASLTATKKEHSIVFKTSLYGVQANESYQVHIHEKDMTQPFGYSGNPVIDLGTFANGNFTQTKEVSMMDYDHFINSFQGYFIVHDPANIQNDTTTLLIYAMTGKIK